MKFRLRTEDDWSKVRNQGHTRWVFIEGPLKFGLPLFVALSALAFAEEYWLSSEPVREWTAWIVPLTITALMCWAGGYIVADLAWHKWADRER